MIRPIFISLTLGLVAHAALAAPMVDKFRFGKFGDVTVYRNSPEPKNIVLFVSGDGGWNLGVVSMAKQLADQDTTVVGIDIRTFLLATEAATNACAYPAADFEQLSQFVQKKLGFKSFHRPVLVGYSSGATLVYAVLAQAPRGTFLGAISLGFCPDLEIRHPWCKGFGLAYTKRADGKGVDFRPIKSITEPWRVLQGSTDQVCKASDAAAFVAQIPTGKFIELPNVGHGFSVERNWLPQFNSAFAEIIALAKRPTPVQPIGTSATPAPADVSELPIVEVPSTATGDAFAVLITGDGGWAGLDRDVSKLLAARGVPVVGLDALAYFWTRRTPEETAHAVQAIVRHYGTAWRRTRVMLIGYSFGGDVMPFVARRLPVDMRKRIKLMTLIVPSSSAQFEFHVAEWAGLDVGDTMPTLPEMQALKDVRTLCIYGTEEKDSLCPKLSAQGARIVGLPGGHHVGGDYAKLVQEIEAAAQ